MISGLRFSENASDVQLNLYLDALTLHFSANSIIHITRLPVARAATLIVELKITIGLFEEVIIAFDDVFSILHILFVVDFQIMEGVRFPAYFKLHQADIVSFALW